MRVIGGYGNGSDACPCACCDVIVIEGVYGCETKDTKNNLSSRVLILIFVLLAAGIVITGYLFYSSYAKNYRTQVEHQLSSITDLKVGEIAQWRKERLGDANFLYENPAFSSLVQRNFEHPDDVDRRRNS